MLHFKFTVLLALAATATSHVIQPKVGPPPPADPQVCANVRDAERYDCYPENMATAEKCRARGCCWVARERAAPAHERAAPLDIPWCFYPPNFRSYAFTNVTESPNGPTGFLQQQTTSAYPSDVQMLKMEVEYQTDTRVRVKITDANNQRYESPYPKIAPSTPSATKARLYDVSIDRSKAGFQVRRSSGEVLFDAQNKGGFIYADQFIQFSAEPLGHIFGLGEHRTELQLNMSWTRLVMMNHDAPPNENMNVYGAHPFYLSVEPDGRSHGVLLVNSDPGEILLQPIPSITYRYIGGILDFYFFLGPTPADVVSQYTELVGKPFMPPFWSFGFQICKYGYTSLDDVKKVYQRTRNAGIPYDVQWVDIDYMVENNDFTYNKNTFGGLPQFVDELHQNGMRFVPILDAGISANEPKGSYPAWDRGLEMDTLIKNDDGSVFVGKVWNPVSTSFPDFFHPRAVEYYTSLLVDLHNDIAYDGIWIDMNEPANFLNGQQNGCPNTRWDNPPYTPAVDGGLLAFKTVCMSAKQTAGRHYDVHNLFGISHADVTNQGVTTALKGRRPFVLSRSTFTGSGKYTGHWSGDNLSGWHDLTRSIPEILANNLFGIPYIGADICGFRDNAWEALCNRWMQLGAFYPFSRNHNTIGMRDQDPAVWGGQVLASSKKYLQIRYTLLPFLYSLFYRAHVYGETVIRPLFFEFPEDPSTHPIDRAFLWGGGFLVVPVTDEQSTSVSVYLPRGRWYDLESGAARDSVGADVVLNAPLDTIPLLVRGGYIIPRQGHAVTTTLSRKTPFTLLVASDANSNAKGQLFWDDGETVDTIENNKFGLVDFVLSGNKLTSDVTQWNTDPASLSSIVIYGAPSVTSVQFNGNSASFNYDSTNKVLTVSSLNAQIGQPFTLTWA